MGENVDNQLIPVEEKLRGEGMNRIISRRALELCDCLVHCLKSSLLKVDHTRASREVKTQLEVLHKLTNVEEMRRSIAGVVRGLKESLIPFLHLLIDHFPEEETPSIETVNTIYENIIIQCTSERIDHSTVKLCLYAAATGIKRAIYVIDENLQWDVYHPLLGMDNTEYIMMYKSRINFHVIETPGRFAPPPKAFGLLGKFMDRLEGDAERKRALQRLDCAVLYKNESVQSFINNCRLIRKKLDDRRQTVTTIVIGSSGVGLLSVIAVSSVLLVPFTGGVSMGLGIVGGVLGMGSGAVAAGFSAHEAFKQYMKLKEIKTLQAIVSQKEEEVSEALVDVLLLFNDENRARDLNVKGIEKKICGYRTYFAAVRSLSGVADLARTVVKVGGKFGKGVALTLAPVSLALDIGVMAEALNTKRKGNKTEAGIILEKTALSAEIKHVLFNSIMRGDCDSRFLLCNDYHV